MPAPSLLRSSPQAFAARLQEIGARRAYFVHDPNRRGVRASHPDLSAIARFFESDPRDYRHHEAVFVEVGPETGTLFGAFLHDTRRGQGQGGLRHWPYADMESFLRDGLRLARGMTRKNALAGLWWGGGKGIIARDDAAAWRDPAYRRTLYAEYARFVTHLRGCYVTAEDAGTNAEDMATVFANTRFSSCIPPDLGGSGNPSPATAKGVVCAMEAALDFLGLGTLAGKTVAMQGTGNVGSAMIGELLTRDVRRIVASEIDAQRKSSLLDRFANAPLEIRLVDPGDDSILVEPCDILAPNALGGTLGPACIDRIAAKIVCGAANNQLLDEDRDARALAARGITYVPDFVCNRMGIVHCANEQYGYVPRDPAIERHFGRTWDNSVFVITKRVLQLAQKQGTTTAEAANHLADELAREPHPIWGHRTRAIIDGLIHSGWADGESP